MFQWNYACTAVFVLFFQVRQIFGQRADFEVPPIQLNRRFVWSTELPLARAINKLAPEAVPEISLTTHHTARVEKAVIEALGRSTVKPDEIVQPCNPEIPTQYRKQIATDFALRGLLQPAWTCATDVPGVEMNHGEKPGYSLEDLYNAVFNQGVAIQQRIDDIALSVIDNFTTPDAVFNHTYKTGAADCVLSATCMYRQGENWRQGIGIDSNKKDNHLIDGLRQSIWEHVRVVDGKLADPILMRLPVYDNGSVERVILENATTFIQGWRGGMNPSCFRKIPIEQNPAMIDALDLTYQSAQQVEGALTTSNLAILVLPLLLTVVPFSLFTEVDSKRLLLYTILSDVLTVIPLGVKGIELVVIGRQRFQSVVTRILSPGFGNTTMPQASGGEIWGAECRVRDGAERTGIILIVTSVVFLCIGITTEMVAKTHARKRRVRWRSRKVKLKSGSIEHGSFAWEASDGNISISSSDTGFVLDSEVGARGVAARYSDIEENPRARMKGFFFSS